MCKGTWKGLRLRCFLQKKLRKAKIKTSLEKIFFCNADADADVNADADAEMPRCQDFQMADRTHPNHTKFNAESCYDFAIYTLD